MPPPLRRGAPRRPGRAAAAAGSASVPGAGRRREVRPGRRAADPPPFPARRGARGAAEPARRGVGSVGRWVSAAQRQSSSSSSAPRRRHVGKAGPSASLSPGSVAIRRTLEVHEAVPVPVGSRRGGRARRGPASPAGVPPLAGTDLSSCPEPRPTGPAGGIGDAQSDRQDRRRASQVRSRAATEHGANGQAAAAGGGSFVRGSRVGRVERKTKETSVLVEIDLDGTGQCRSQVRRILTPPPHTQPGRR